MTFFEKRRGTERLPKTKPDRAASILAGIDALEAGYMSRVVPIDSSVIASDPGERATVQAERVSRWRDGEVGARP